MKRVDSKQEERQGNEKMGEETREKKEENLRTKQKRREKIK